MAQTRLLEAHEKRLKMEMAVKELEEKKQQEIDKAVLPQEKAAIPAKVK